MKSFKVVSFFTPEYADEARKLKASLLEHGVDNVFYPMKSEGSWVRNCQIKSKVLLQALEEYPNHNVVWIDSDATVHSSLEIFNSLTCDIAYCFLDNERQELLSGTIFLQNNEKCKYLLRLWIELNSTNEEWDQHNLQKVIEKFKGNIGLDILHLPFELCYIFDNDYQKSKLTSKPLIVHNQASRRLKRVVANNHGT